MKKVICNVLAVVLMTSGGNLCMAAKPEAKDLVCVDTGSLNEENSVNFENISMDINEENQDATQKDRKDSEDLCEPLKTEGLTEQQKNDIKAIMKSLLEEYDKKRAPKTSILKTVLLFPLKLIKLLCTTLLVGTECGVFGGVIGGAVIAIMAGLIPIQTVIDFFKLTVKSGVNYIQTMLKNLVNVNFFHFAR